MIVIYVDDEKVLLENFVLTVKDVSRIDELHTFHKSADALSFVKNNPIDVAFLDIEMPEMNGLELARIMKERVEGKGIAARYGGEEFMLLFEEADHTAAMEIMNQMKAELREYSMRTRQIAITFSAGVEEYRTEERIDVLFHNADQKLYQAKNSGKNRMIF